MALLGPDNRICATVDVKQAALPSGDVVIDASDCPAGVALSAIVGREGTATPPTLLLSQAHPRDGYAVPLALVFPPPGTGAVPSPAGSGAVTPVAPDTGLGAAASSSPRSNNQPAMIGIAAVVLAGSASLGFVAWRRKSAWRAPR